MLEYNTQEDKWAEIPDKWKYNLSKHSIEEQGTFADRLYNWQEGIVNKVSLRSILVSGKVNWEDGQQLIENTDFYITTSNPPFVAQPLEYNKDIDWEDLKTEILGQYSDSKVNLMMPFNYNSLYAAMEEYFVQKTSILNESIVFKEWCDKNTWEIENREERNFTSSELYDIFKNNP